MTEKKRNDPHSGQCKKQFRAAFRGISMEITPRKLQRLRATFADLIEYIEVDQVPRTRLAC